MQTYQTTQAQLRAMVDDGVVPGMSYCLFERDWQVEAVRGLAQIEPTPERLRPGMLYDLASLTKVVATVPVIAILLQSGRLSLDDPVSRYLPEFSNDQVKIYHLLTHSSAIGGYIKNRDDLDAKQLTTALLTNQTSGVNRDRLIRYADVNFIYLGWIAERILGQPIHVLARELVFAPLQMTQITDQPVATQTVPTSIDQRRGLLRGQVHDPKGAVLGSHCGSAGFFAPLTDLITFSRALVGTNLAGLLTEQTMAQLFSDQTRMVSPHLRGLGWKLVPNPATHRFLISHTGYTGTLLVLDRDHDRGLIMLTNRVHPRGKNNRYLDRRDQIITTYLREMGEN